MSKKIRKPQAPKQRNFVAKAMLDRDGPYAPKSIPNKKKAILEAKKNWHRGTDFGDWQIYGLTVYYKYHATIARLNWITTWTMMMKTK